MGGSYNRMNDGMAAVTLPLWFRIHKKIMANLSIITIIELPPDYWISSIWI
jgi:hypothetical protein